MVTRSSFRRAGRRAHDSAQRAHRAVVRVVLSALALLCALGFAGSLAHAALADQLTFTVTPPLFQLSLQPGETWSSSLTVVNGNAYDITVFAQPVLFEPDGEDGRPRFVGPVAGEESTPDPSTLAGWIDVPRGGLLIKREQTIAIPLSISVPEGAAPGGHYAAILIGNRAPGTSPAESSLSVTSSIASLIFLRVAGDVTEQGRIRDFVTDRSIYERPEAKLSLRFEDQGNVHLRPQGDITIYNMFDQKRGYIPVNQTAGYGNVLPGSVRKFTFTWTADSGTWDIGRYRAVATLGYGTNGKQFATATTYFWVLPIVPLVEVIGGAFVFLWFIGWAVRAYVRRALALETARLVQEVGNRAVTSEGAAGTPLVGQAPASQHLRLETLIRPLEAGIVDLRHAGGMVEGATADMPAGTGRLSFVAFVRAYRYFFFFLAVVILGVFGARVFLSDVLSADRPYHVTVEHPDGATIDVAPLGPASP